MSRYIEIDTGSIVENFNCPVCGEDAREGSCPHVLFSFCDLAEPYEDDELASQFYNLMFDDETEGFTNGDGEKAIELMDLPQSAFIIAMTSHGVACCCMSATEFYCFDVTAE